MILLLVAAAVVLVIVFHYSGKIFNSSAESIERNLFVNDFNEGRACFNENCFNLEVSDDPDERTMGLEYKDSMKVNQAMLFIFDSQGEQGIWMKNMNFPLDILWLDSNMAIVDISENNLPCTSDECPTVVNDVPALYVLEINAGLSEKIGLKMGDIMDIDLG